MARVKYNVVSHGISGIIGDLLEFRQRYGRTIIAKLRAKTNKVTPAQLLVRDKFRRAASYAKSAIQDPVVKAIYEQNASGDMTPYVLAVKDYFVAPLLHSINTGNYTGMVGSPIKVNATDDTKVAAVRVRIFDANGGRLEEGEALQQVDTDIWVYTTTVANGSLTGCRIVAEASDMPGNITTGETVL